MPRSTRPAFSPGTHISKKIRKHNSSGFQKRKNERKGLPHDDDVYEYQPEPLKRSRQTVSLKINREEAAGAGSEDEDAEDEDLISRVKAQIAGDGAVANDDDEEIDSDEAFEESDEERFAGFGFGKNASNSKKSKSQKSKARATVHFADIDLKEEGSLDDTSDDEENENEEDEEEFLDALDVFDGKAGADNENDVERLLHPQGIERDGMVSETETTDEDEDDASDNGLILPSDTEDAPEALDELENLITSLDSGLKRKAEGGASNEDSRPKQKRRVLKERTEAGPESTFGAQVSSSSKLKLDDLLAPLASHSSTFQSLKSSIRPLTSSNAKPLAAPLPQRTQERLDREAAYEQTKEEVKKWNETMQMIKDAEHLSFPLQSQPATKISNLELTAKFKPTTEMESSIDRLLKSAKMRDEDLPATEALKMNHLSVEEVAARRAELRKMRELMFRAELKAKRVAKIKSKTYRRIRKKQQEKLDLAAGEDDDVEMDEEARHKAEVERARERATLRHKNTGKWAKAMNARDDLDVDQRREISEMLERGEKLRRRIQGKKDDDGENEDDSDSDSGLDEEKVKSRAFDELARLQSEDENDTEVTSRGKGVFQMKFMKDAMARERHKARGMVDDIIQEMHNAHGQNSESGESASGIDDIETATVAVERTGGRMSFRPTPIEQHQQLRPPASDTSSVTLKSTDFATTAYSPVAPTNSMSPPSHMDTSLVTPSASALAQEENPWLASHDRSSSKTMRKKNEIVVGKDSNSILRAQNKLRKQGLKRNEEKEKAADEATVEIDMEQTFTLPSSSKLGPSVSNNGSSHSKAEARASHLNVNDDAPEASSIDSDANDELDEQEKMINLKGKGKTRGPKAFEQRDLVARAFAGDDVVQAFEEAKRFETEGDAPNTVDTTLEGWGSWGGAGIRRQAPKPHLIKKVAGIDPTSRADYGKKHVIISEKRDKKAAKYLVKDLPYPYTSKAQFDRSMETPLGAEWNTRVGFQRGTLPKVAKKMGTVITPLEKLF